MFLGKPSCLAHQEDAIPATYDAVVIGSGLGGLTAAALYARTGARVLILERNETFGGAATTYRHGGLTIEASLHETTHPDMPGDPKHAVFEALDLADDVEFVPVDDFQEVRCKLIGPPFVLPHGFDAVESVLADRFPRQRDAIHRFLRQIRRTLRVGEFSGEQHSLLWRTAHAGELPLDLWALFRDIGSSLSDVLERYFGDDEAIKFALCANLPYFSDNPDDFWWLGYAMAQGGYLHGGGHYIRGGSQRLSDRLVEIVRQEGGEALAGAEVTGIEVDAYGSVTGVEYRVEGTQGSQLVRTKVVFGNAAPDILAGMLPGDLREDFKRPYRGRTPSISLVSITLGLDRPASEFGVSSYSTMLIPEWMKDLSDFRRCSALFEDPPATRMPAISLVDFNQIDSGLAKGGLYPVSVVCPDRYANWRDLDESAYRLHRDRWLDAIIAHLDTEWPGIAAAVREKTMATARTMREHLNTPDGAVYGYALQPPDGMLKGPPIAVQTSVDGLWLASAFAGAGGFSGAMSCGAAAAQAVVRAKQPLPLL